MDETKRQQEANQNNSAPSLTNQMISITSRAESAILQASQHRLLFYKRFTERPAKESEVIRLHSRSPQRVIIQLLARHTIKYTSLQT